MHSKFHHKLQLYAQRRGAYAPSAKGCGSFARTGLRVSATSTHRPLPLPETKARRRSRQQHRRQAESGSNVACRPCSSPDYHSIATQAGFFDLIQCGEPPGTIAGIAALETIPSRPSLQACSNTIGPFLDRRSRGRKVRAIICHRGK